MQSLAEEGIDPNEAPSEFGQHDHKGTMRSLVEDGIDPNEAPSEFGWRGHAAGIWKSVKKLVEKGMDQKDAVIAISLLVFIIFTLVKNMSLRKLSFFDLLY